jgi:hypothetical protein
MGNRRAQVQVCLLRAGFWIESVGNRLAFRRSQDPSREMKRKDWRKSTIEREAIVTFRERGHARAELMES